MKILILGGTGSMGLSLVPILEDMGNDIWITSRSVHNSPSVHIHYIQGNAHDIDFLQKILRNNYYDAIVDFMLYKLDELSDRLDILLQSTKQYVFLSSSRVYANSDNPITENDPRLLNVCKDEEYLKTDEYALRKAKEEDLLYNSSKNNWTIIRPYITFNVNRLQLGVLEKELWLYRALHGRTIVFHEEIANHITTLTYGFDVANAIAKLIGNPLAIGETVHITTNENICWKDVLTVYLDSIERITGKRPKVKLLKDTNTLVSIMHNKYQINYDRSYDRVFNNNKINMLIGDNSFSDVKESLKYCIERFMQKPSYLKLNWPVQGYFDHITNEKTPLSEIGSNKEKLGYLLYRYAPICLANFIKKLYKYS